MSSGTQVELDPADVVARPAASGRVQGYRVATLSLILLTGLWRLVALSHWSWQADDWLFIERTRQMGFWQYLFQIHNGHFQPGQFLVFWDITARAPLAWPLGAAAAWTLSMLSLVVWALLLRALLGDRWAAVIALVPVAIAPGFVPIVAWVAAALTVYSLQLFLGLTLLCSLGWARSGQRSSLWLTAAAYVLGLLFWEKCLLAIIPAVGLSLLLARTSSGRLVRRRVVVLTAVLGAIAAVYSAVYLVVLAHSDSQGTTWVLRGVGDLAQFYWSALTQNLLPALTGGPLPSSGQAGTGLLIPTSAAQWIITAGAIVLTIWGLGRRRRGWIPVLTAGVYVVVSMGLVVLSSRYDAVGLVSALDTRYAADSLVVIALFGTLLLVPARGEPDALRPREDGPVRLPRWVGPGIAAATVAMALATSAAVWDGIAPTSPKPWVDSFLSSLHQVGDGAVVDSVPPGNVLNAYLAGPAARTSAMSSVLDLPVQWNGASPQLRMFEATGLLRDAVVTPSLHAFPVPGCGYLVPAGGQVSLPVDTHLFAWQWGLQMAYSAEQDGTLRVTADARTIVVPVVEGKGEVKAVLDDSVSRPITISNPGTAPACVAWIAVGQLSPAPAASP